MPLDPESLDDQSWIVHKSARNLGRGLITSVAWGGWSGKFDES